MRRDVLQAISDPIRKGIIHMLVGSCMNLDTVSENFEISRPAISKQIKILVECSLIRIKQQGRERLCEIQLQKLGEVNDWIFPYRNFWSAKLDNLDPFLKTQIRKNFKSSEKLK